MKSTIRNSFVSLLLASLREKRITALVWIIGGSLAMYFEAIAIAAELHDFPGGGAALAQSIYPSIEGMRIIRWPADRLDTLGGYLAYHNVVLFNFFLAIFAAVQGSRTVRYLEQTRDIEFYLATGVSRIRFLWVRSLAFYITLIVISSALGLSTALAMSVSGEPNFYGSVITLLAGGICVSIFFAIALLISQFTKASRSASGITVIVITVIYAIGNIADKYVWLSWFKSLSPFYYANLSRPLIVGFNTNYPSWILMLSLGFALIGISGIAFNQRDIEGVMFHRAPQTTLRYRRRRPEFVPTTLTGDILWRQRVVLTAWTLAIASFMGLFVSLMNGVVEVWAKFSFLEQFTSMGFGKTPTEQFLALIYEVIPIFVAAFIIYQASAWTIDFIQGRTALFLSTPISNQRLIISRVCASVISSFLIAAGAILVIILGSQLQGAVFDQTATTRFLLINLLFASALTSLCVLLVAILRQRSVTQILSLYIGTSWIVIFMAPYLGWPKWVTNLSIFDALGHPYIDYPSNSRILFLMFLTGPILYIAIQISNRLPKSR